jgi:hypothetical protein
MESSTRRMCLRPGALQEPAERLDHDVLLVQDLVDLHREKATRGAQDENGTPPANRCR